MTDLHYVRMTKDLWEKIKHFSPENTSDNWGEPNKMIHDLVLGIDKVREYIDKPICIHCGYQKRDSGWHPYGMAADLHVKDMCLLDQFLLFSRFKIFTGIGVYPWWHSPGLHVDIRPVQLFSYGNLWGSVAPKKYVVLDKDFFDNYL